jgi:chromosome segregation ATPase
MTARFRPRLLLPVMAVSAFLAAMPTAGRGESPMPREQLDAYVAMIQADRARDRGAFKEAVQGYREAQLAYERLAKTRPELDPRIVEFRRTYCANQIDALLKQAGKSEEELLAEPPSPDEGALATSRARYVELLKAHNALQDEVASARQAIEQTRREAEAREADVNRLRDDMERVRNQLTTSTNAMTAAQLLSEQVAASLKVENERLKRELASRSGPGPSGTPDAMSLQAEFEQLVLEDGRLRRELADTAAKLDQAVAARDSLLKDQGRMREEVEAMRRKDSAHDAVVRKRDEEIDRLTADNKRLAGERNAAAALSGKVEKDLAERDRKLESLRSEWEASKTKAQSLEQALKVRSDDVDRLAAAEAQARNSVAEAQQTVRAKEAALTDLTKQYEGAKAELTRLEATRQQSAALAATLEQKDRRIEELTRLTTDLEAARTNLEAAVAGIAPLQNEKEALLKADAGHRGMMARLQQENATLQEALAAMRKEIEGLLSAVEDRGRGREALVKDLDASRQQLAEAGATARAKENELADARKQAEEVRRMYETLQERYQTLEKRALKADKTAESLGRDIEAARQRNEELTKENKRLAGELDRASESRRTRELEALVAGLREQLQAARQELSETRDRMAGDQDAPVAR